MNFGCSLCFGHCFVFFEKGKVACGCKFNACIDCGLHDCGKD